jgi:hypothetical protein
VEVSNLPIGLDFKNDTTNQGCGDARAPNLPIGLDPEDEDGDNENHSPSMYLNLNEDDEEDDAGNAEHEGSENEEDDARNAEHEGGVNEEDEGNVEQALVGTLSTSQVRRGYGLNKLPSGCFVIMAVNEVGDPTQPLVLVNAWETSVGKLLRENVPITYRFWKGKTHEEACIAPDSIKQNLWDTKI